MSNQNHHNQQTQGHDALRQRLLQHSLMRPDRLPSIGKELAYAIADIRQKLIEEGAWGRTVTPESIHGRPHEQAGNTLDRFGAVDHFRDRCRLIHESREQFTAERCHERDR